jgi:hypothetical protein
MIQYITSLNSQNNLQPTEEKNWFWWLSGTITYISARGRVLGQSEGIETIRTECGVDVGAYSSVGDLLQQKNHAPQVVGPGCHVQWRVRALLVVALSQSTAISQTNKREQIKILLKCHSLKFEIAVVQFPFVTAHWWDSGPSAADSPSISHPLLYRYTLLDGESSWH